MSAFVRSAAGVNVVSRRPSMCERHGARQSRTARVNMGLLDMFGNKSAAEWTIDAGYASYPMVGKNRGEDAFYIEGNSMGVFDGVSSAAGEGKDPQAFSQFLAVNTSSGVRSMGLDKVAIALNDAAEVNPEEGASTACVISMDKYGRMIGINLGDSGVMVARNGKSVYRSKDQSHFFNCPYQLGSASEDTVAMGKNIRCQLKERDWIVLASDGLWDNVYEKDILRIVDETIKEYGEDPNAIANNLAQEAIRKSSLEAYTSPFAAEAKKVGQDHRGGKLDDVTVLAAQVTTGSDLYSIVSAA